MSTNSPGVEEIQRVMWTSLRQHRRLFLMEGIVVVVLGVAAIAIPQFATFAIEILLGWVFLLSGAAGLITTCWMRRAPGFIWSLTSAILGIFAGIVLLAWPLSGMVTLTFFLILYFLIEGVSSMMFALEHKRQASGRTGWMLASGIVDLIIAAIFLSGLPGTATWALGLLVGINMLFGGSALIAMVLHADRTDSSAVV